MTPDGPMVLREGGDPSNIADYRPQIQPNTGDYTDSSNAAEQMMVKTGMERTSIFTSADFDLTDNIRFATDASFNRRETSVQVAGYPYQSGAVDVQTPMSPDSYFNPTGEELDFRRRGWEVPRVTERRLDTYRFSGVFEGSFDVGDRYFDWDAGYLFSRGDAVIRARGDFNKLAVAQAVGPSFMNDEGVIQCGTPDNPIGLDACTPWSPVLSEGQYSLANPDIQNRFFMWENATSETDTHNYFVNFSGNAYPIHETGSNTFHDVQFRMDVPWNATVALGVNNVFDREGQVLFTGPSSEYSYYGGFDFGRFAYMKYQQRF